MTILIKVCFILWLRNNGDRGDLLLYFECIPVFHALHHVPVCCFWLMQTISILYINYYKMNVSAFLLICCKHILCRNNMQWQLDAQIEHFACTNDQYSRWQISVISSRIMNLWYSVKMNYYLMNESKNGVQEWTMDLL